ncbi:MAG TPA: type I DNA topoisomerase [Vitreimonas sp.]|nr:type I DNA topoisomerase [Vitreimonas sp.]
MKLVIVESPTKARKLSEYLGKEYAIEASVGHVRDLPKKELGIDLEHDFEPKYVVDPDKKKVVTKLQDLAAKAEIIYLATDPDREGEAIAWHIQHLLSESKKGKTGGEARRFQRATFHEITKSAVLEAINKPAQVSLELVNAQQARRVVDRLVGYQVSPVLWKKVRRGLSAGRVQSVALRLIVEREREIAVFVAEEYWELDVLLNTAVGAKLGTTINGLSFRDHRAELEKQGLPTSLLVARVTEANGKKYEPTTAEHVQPVLADLEVASYRVNGIEKKSRERSSLPPFTTSTLQQAAATRLGFTSKQTMTLAQQLYEEGLITYHRTDSFNLSTQSVEMARTYIHKEFGQAYLPEKPRYFATKSKNAQEAHEAIRVTNVSFPPSAIRHQSSKFTERHEKLYDLIWRRFLASQMNSAIYDQTAITIQADHQASHYLLRANGSVLRFDGWMKLFSASDDTLLPEVKDSQSLDFVDRHAAQKFTQPPPRYNDASLVKELEKRGIGRPSTYASIISVIEDRGYVERLDKRFVATQIGMTVSEFLQQHFPVFMEYDFTAEMEEDLDRISRGEKEWRKVIKEFYSPLAKTIAQVTKDAERVQIPVEETGEKCPKCGEADGGMVVIRSGRFGKFKSCNRFPECDFTENIVEKVEGMHCPLCQQGEVIVKNSRWGKSFFGCSRYPDCDWASWKKPELNLRVTPEEWAQQKAERQARFAKKKETMAGKSSSGSKSKAQATTKQKKSKAPKKPAKRSAKK